MPFQPPANRFLEKVPCRSVLPTGHNQGTCVSRRPFPESISDARPFRVANHLLKHQGAGEPPANTDVRAPVQSVPRQGNGLVPATAERKQAMRRGNGRPFATECKHPVQLHLRHQRFFHRRELVSSGAPAVGGRCRDRAARRQPVGDRAQRRGRRHLDGHDVQPEQPAAGHVRQQPVRSGEHARGVRGRRDPERRHRHGGTGRNVGGRFGSGLDQHGASARPGRGPGTGGVPDGLRAVGRFAGLRSELSELVFWDRRLRDSAQPGRFLVRGRARGGPSAGVWHGQLMDEPGFGQFLPRHTFAAGIWRCSPAGPREPSRLGRRRSRPGRPCRHGPGRRRRGPDALHGAGFRRAV